MIDDFKSNIIRPIEGKALWELTDVEVTGLVTGTLQSNNAFFSESLSTAADSIRRSGNADLMDAFVPVATTLMTGDYARHGGQGFAYRDSLGTAINRLLDSGDLGAFNRFSAWVQNHEGGLYGRGADLLGPLKLLRAELKLQCMDSGMEVYASAPVASGAAGPQRTI